MPAATGTTGKLIPIKNCYISIPGLQDPITFNVLPEISDQKNAEYTPENIIGRSTPLTTYSHSSARTIGMTIHFLVLEQSDIQLNLFRLRALESLVYPDSYTLGTPYVPPLISRMRCGSMLSVDPTWNADTKPGELSVILKSYSVKFPTDVVWDEETLLPYKFDLELSWEVIYDSNDLPGQHRILQEGK